MVPLSEPWASLTPGGGLRRGSTVVVHAQPGLGGLSVALSLLSEASDKGHWSAVVGVDDPGVVAMSDLGVDLRRVLFVPRPRGAWAEAAADLLDGVDLLIVRPPSRCAHGAARKLMDRVRDRIDCSHRARRSVASARRPFFSPHQFALDHVVTSRRALRDVARRWTRRGRAPRRARGDGARSSRSGGGAISGAAPRALGGAAE